MAYVNEMTDVQKVMEKVPTYSTWHPSFNGKEVNEPVMKKVDQDSLKSHINSHDK